ncbi:N-acetylglucosaminyltransferase [Trema orientale]|uniref:N-acetylglucosaminyltransferase n=1 Tax=Trema orientale TaxID=63057 RepID=A0A2P5FVT3_TREOI|nr:N-acetylglucosaminyltransferase [Trema orientale]
MTTISYLFLTPKLPILPIHKIPPSNLKILSCLSLKQSTDQTVTSQDNAVSVENLRVVFAAGGTGGHIYPAVAIADELKLAKPKSRILFLGTPNSMESAAITSAGYDFEPIPAVRLGRPILLSPQNLFLPYRLFKSTIQSLAKLRAFDPHVVVGTGGYVSFPTCLAAAIRGVKLVIQEQNSVPGLANWVISHLSDVVFVAFNSTVDCFPKGKCVVSGNPVRLSSKKAVSKASARLRFFPRSETVGDEEAKVVLVLGGSLGANAVNIAVLNLYYQMLMESEKVFVIWQTGVQAFNEMESLVKNHPRLHLTPFMHSMDLAYLAADLVISRAGAMTCYEILAHGKPSILIPSPNVAEGHQFKNASLMADLADARVISEDELDSTTLKNAIEELLGNEKKMADMSERALKAAKPNASAEIVQHILSLVDLPTSKKQL